MTEHRRRFYHGSDPGRARARTHDILRKIALKGRRESPCNEAVGPAEDRRGLERLMREMGSDRVQAPCTRFRLRAQRASGSEGRLAARQRQAGPWSHGPEAEPPAYALRAARSRVRGGSPAALCSAKFILCYKVRLLLTSPMRRKSHNDGGSDWMKEGSNDELSEVVREARRRSREDRLR